MESPSLTTKDIIKTLETNILEATTQMNESTNYEDWDYHTKVWFYGHCLLFSHKWNQ
jgi:hypothetical protein